MFAAVIEYAGKIMLFGIAPILAFITIMIAVHYRRTDAAPECIAIFLFYPGWFIFSFIIPFFWHDITFSTFVYHLEVILLHVLGTIPFLWFYCRSRQSADKELLCIAVCGSAAVIIAAAGEILWLIA